MSGTDDAPKADLHLAHIWMQRMIRMMRIKNCSFIDADNPESIEAEPGGFRRNIAVSTSLISPEFDICDPDSKLEMCDCRSKKYSSLAAERLDCWLHRCMQSCLRCAASSVTMSFTDSHPFSTVFSRS